MLRCLTGVVDIDHLKILPPNIKVKPLRRGACLRAVGFEVLEDYARGRVDRDVTHRVRNYDLLRRTGHDALLLREVRRIG